MYKANEQSGVIIRLTTSHKANPRGSCLTNVKINYLGLFLIILIIVFGTKQNLAQQSENAEEDSVEKYNPEQLIDDFDYLFKTLESIHPDLYFYTSKDFIDAFRKKAISKINHPMTDLEFWKVIAPVVVKLNDGHTATYFPKKVRKDYLDNGGIIFPFDVKAENNKLFVSKNYTQDSLIGINSEILSINKIPVDSILNKMRLYHNGERLSFIDLKVSWFFKPYIWVLFNFRDSFQLDFISCTDGKPYSKNYSGITYDNYKSLKKVKQSRKTPYSFYTIPDTKIGVIDFRSMVDYNAFQKFLDSTVRIVLNDSLQDLIIDVRKNGGGNSNLADALLSHFNKKPYTQATQMDVKVSKQARKQFRQIFFKWYMYPLYPIALFNSYSRPVLFGKKGKVISRYSEPKEHEADKLFFNGNVYLLTGTNTFSSANILAAVFKCYNMGTMIGEETGGLTIAFGDIVNFELPNTKLKAGCSYKKFYHPCGKPDNHGVIPDIEVKQNKEDIKQGKDAVMDFTVDYILTNTLNGK